MSLTRQSHTAQTAKVKSTDKAKKSGHLRDQRLHPATLADTITHKPGALSPQQVLNLQAAVGNRAVIGLLNGSTNHIGSREKETDGQKTIDGTASSGLPAALKSSIENLSGISLNDVRVHYNSTEPKQVQALAYTRGTEIHLGPGQEEHIAHEAWHVVQQKQGRVSPTLQLKTASINDDSQLEHEADAMGEKASGTMTRMKTHDKACGCPACRSSQPKNTSRTRISSPALQSQSRLSLGGASMGVIQRKCEICGQDDHKTARCPMSKEARDKHKEKVVAFQSAKQKQLEDMRQQEKEADRSGSRKKKAATEAFSKKHVAPTGVPLEKASRKAAQEREWGGGRQSGKSTTVAISPEDQQKETRYHMEALKLDEADVDGDTVAPKYGVVKPTKFDYPTQTSTVETDENGKRIIQPEEPKLARPVLAMNNQGINHLHGVEDD